MSNFELSALLKDVEHEIIQEALADSGGISSITIDSRKVKPGALFICIRGLTVDGHNFISKAVELGAAAVLVEELPTGVVMPLSLAVVRVKNTRQAMAYIAANYHGNPAEKLRLVGVTGTNGKTTTTYFIEEILRMAGRKTGLIGTIGIMALGKPMKFDFATDTTPDPLELHDVFAQMLNMGVTDVIMEVSSHALALFKMEGLVFDIGVFTNLTQDHLDFHGTMENYRLAKAQLFTQSSYAVVNVDDESTPVMLQYHGSAPFLTYSIDRDSDLQALHIEYRPQGSVFELAEEDGTLQSFTLPVEGRFNIYNSLAAIGVAHVLGLDIDMIRGGVAGLSGVPGRIQSVPNRHGVHVLVDYAHSPDGLTNIISSVREFLRDCSRIITLFGCGGDRDREKRPIMGQIAGELSDYCIITSDNPRTEHPMEIIRQIEPGVHETGTPYEICENRRDAIFTGVRMLKPGDALIIAGKGHEDYQIIGTVKHHFSDFETAVNALD